MSGSDWALVSLIVFCVGAVTLTLGYLWGLWRGLGIADDTIEELHGLRVGSQQEAQILRNDLARMMNKRLEL